MTRNPIISLTLVMASALSVPSIAGAGPSTVAEVSSVEGNAIATQADRYVPVRDGMKLGEGDRLLVLGNSKAVVTYPADGCQVQLKDMALLSVRSTSTCASGGAGIFEVQSNSAVAHGSHAPLRLAALSKGSDNPPSATGNPLKPKKNLVASPGGGNPPLPGGNLVLAAADPAPPGGNPSPPPPPGGAFLGLPPGVLTALGIGVGFGGLVAISNNRNDNRGPASPQ
ncbi:MAG: hypothetical protein P9F75_01775 [Candidatus Contendobacter sp.]|nr:hypothetical protein [Candidatus Contendobacter sp.]